MGVSLCSPVLSSSCRTLTTQRLPPHPGGFGRTRWQGRANIYKIHRNISEYHIVFHFKLQISSVEKGLTRNLHCEYPTCSHLLSRNMTWSQNCPKLAQTHPNAQQIHSVFDQNYWTHALPQPFLPSNVPQPPRGRSQLKRCQMLRIRSHPNLASQIRRNSLALISRFAALGAAKIP